MRDTIIDRFLVQSRRHAQAPALWYRDPAASASHGYRAMSWGQYEERCRLFAAALIGQGVALGECLAICSYNCPEWLIADVGAMMAAVVPAGIYHTDAPAQIQYIVSHCEARVVVLEDPAQWRKFQIVREQCPRVERVVLIRGASQVQDPMVVAFADFLEEGRPNLTEVQQRIDALEPGQLATLIYTSGTTAAPKGVMLSHANLAATASMAHEVIGEALVGTDDTVVSYLPLSHIAEQMFSIHLAITLGYQVWFAPDLEGLRETLKAARPTIFFGVPRVWEKFHAALEARLAEATGLKGRIVRWARGVGHRTGQGILANGRNWEPKGLAGLEYRLASRLFFGKLAGQLGLDRLRIALSAAAPIGREVLEFFLSCNIPVYELYGQSEGCGPTTFNYPVAGKTRLGTVGVAMPGTEVRIAGDGEILARGPNIFMGYYKDEAATAEALVEGWLHSGDIGQLDAQGFLTITDRKKNILITSGGKNVAPQPLEARLKAIEGISQAVVLGDRQKYLTALLTLEPESAQALARREGWPTDVEAMAHHAGLLAHVQAGIDALNRDVARVEAIKRFVVLPREFTEESGELTPTRKIKRREVLANHAREIEGMYAATEASPESA